MTTLMKKAALGFLLGLALLAPARAQTIGPITNGPYNLPLFGTQPITYSNGFNGSGPALIRVTLSAPDILTTGTFVVNGVQIMQLSDFANGVTQVDRFVTLIGQNTFSFTVAGTRGQSVTLTVYQVIMPTPSGLSPNPLALNLGTNGTLTATLSPTPTAAGTLDVSSGNPAVATVPASIGFASGQASVAIPVTTVGAGSSTITASANGGQAQATVNVNAPPTVSITSPAAGTVFTAPASFTITASAADADGTIAQVDFYQGTTLLGTATAAPYSFAWTNVAAGSYSLTAVATDDRGGATTSAAVPITANALPTVSITAPADGALFPAPATITVTANASDRDGTIAKVDFFQGTTLIGTATASPYSITWADVASGAYALSAVATDNSGATTTSAVVNIRVNSAPSVSITTPANGASFSAPASIAITANAADADGTIAKVEFFRNGILITTLTSAPYSFTWTGVPQGSYVLTAVATDDSGAATTSAGVTVTVNAGVAQMYFIHPDHLNTPRSISDQGGNEVWRWENTEPFGDSVPNGDPNNTGNTFDFPMRLSSYYADKETGMRYAMRRDCYDSGIGRFCESDPIGLRGGLNTYLYAGADPIRLVDPTGEAGENPGGTPGLGDRIPRGPLPPPTVSPNIDTLVLRGLATCVRILAGPVGVVVGVLTPSPLACPKEERECQPKPQPIWGLRD